VSNSSGAEAYSTALKYCCQSTLQSTTVATYRLHDVLEGVEADIARGGLDLGVHRHGQTLASGREDEGPLPADEGELDGDERQDGSEDTGQVDVHVLLVRVRDGPAAAVDVVAQEDDGKERPSQVEGPCTLAPSLFQGSESAHSSRPAR